MAEFPEVELLHLDEKGRWIDVMTEASILPVNKRPRLAVRIHSSN